MDRSITETDRRFMQLAIDEARLSLAEGGIPIGAVLARGEELIGQGHNRRVQTGNPLSHGETDCLFNIGRIGSYAGTTMYSTLDPCYMCGGTAVQFKVPRVVFGESVNFTGSHAFMAENPYFNIVVIDLVLPECIAMMGQWIAANPKLWFEDIGEL